MHIHFKIRHGGNQFTSQLYFDDALTDVVHSQPRYSARGPRTPRNQGDGIFRRGGRELLLRPASNGAGGDTATFDIALRLSGDAAQRG